MIITKTPFRISFFGGGTDYPQWYRKEGGAVLSTTIDKYCYLSCRRLPPFFDIKYRVVWSHIETVLSISEILHPAVREGLRYLGFDNSEGLEIHHQGDLPARAGMGSSSSFSVGLIKSLLTYKNIDIDSHELALRAIDLEQNHLKENVGCQDQIAVSHGGFNCIRFSPDGTIKVDPVQISPECTDRLQSRLMLFYTGTSRDASEIAAETVSELTSREDSLRSMLALVDEGQRVLEKGTDLDDFGRLLDDTWRLKRSLCSAISNKKVDSIYEAATRSGALGGKLLGAGGSGFMVFYVRPEAQEHVRKALSNYLYVPFRFEESGCRVIQDSQG